MSSISPCPYCGQSTAVPEGLDSQTMVRCPICHYEFVLDHALINAADAPPEHIAELPPALIPTDDTAVAEVPSSRVDAERPEQGAESSQVSLVSVELSATENASALAGLPVAPRKRSPIRSVIGVVISGLLGLAVAYAVLNWLGPPKLRFWVRPKGRAVGGETSTSSATSPHSAAAPLSEPGSGGEFPGLDEQRFTDVPNHVQPFRSANAPK
jgi:hypothetical protein